ncbi:MAG: NFACT family protein, partial [Ktedonobacteraceae bacterium]|nr:NFACT family protein [Ktedonobacteraceae bacterium]
MYVDAITLAAIASEWRAWLIGARIDTVIQPTEHAIAIQCYVPARAEQSGQNRWLYLSAHPQLARAHLTARRPPKIASEPPPFVMLLRKYLEGARIEAIGQPRWERALEIIAGYRRDPDSEERIRFRLIIEIMGRVSNIIFCDEQDQILGSLKRVGADVNRYRVISAGVAYVPPPPQQRTVVGRSLPRLEPTTVTASQLSICAAEEPAEPQVIPDKPRKRAPARPELWQLLTKNLLGCSPLLAREAVYRTTENTTTPVEEASEAVWEELAWNVCDLTSAYDSHHWQPQLVERGTSSAGDGASPVAFAAYPLEQYSGSDDLHIRAMPSMNETLDEYFALAEWRDALEDVRAPVRKVLQTQRDRCKRKADLLQQELANLQEAQQYRLYGELLLAHQHEVSQGPASVTLPNFFVDDSPMITIPLDPRFDAVGNANRNFTRYHKLRRAAELVPGQIEQNAAELATLEQLLTDL